MPANAAPVQEEIPVMNNVEMAHDEPAPEQVTLPKTEAERKKAHLAFIEGESDDKRSVRRASELSAHYDTHLENIKSSHEKFPTRTSAKEVWGEDWAEFYPSKEAQQEDQKRWNLKRHDIDMANRAYHLAVRRTCNDHRSEDIHLAKRRADAAKAKA